MLGLYKKLFNKNNKNPAFLYEAIVSASKKINYVSLTNNHTKQSNKGLRALTNFGLQLKEIRNYIPGDDVRLIDPNTSARHNEAFVKIYEEHQETEVIIVIDASSSVWKSSHNFINYVTTLCTALALAIAKKNINVNIAFFNENINPSFLNSKTIGFGKKLFEQLIQLQNNNSNLNKTNYAGLAKFLLSNLKSFHEVYIITDGFMNEQYEASLTKIKQNFQMLCKKHAVQLLLLKTVYNKNIKGLVTFRDAESNTEIEMDASSAYVVDFYNNLFNQHVNKWKSIINGSFSEVLTIDENYDQVLNKFFAKRF